MATGTLRLTANPPEVTTPTGAASSSLRNNGAPALAGRAARLADRPIERRLDGRRGLVKIGAVEAQASLKPETVARAEPDWGDRRMTQQRIAQRLCDVRRHADLEPVLAGIAGAGHETRRTWYRGNA